MTIRHALVVVVAVLLVLAFFAFSARKTPIPSGTIAFLGDSITAGNGVDPTQAYPALIVIPGMTMENLGVSGYKSVNGLQKLHPYFASGATPRLVVVALGANDIVSGTPPELTEANLNDIVKDCLAHHAAVLLCGVKIPFKFETAAIFQHVASHNNVPLVPDILMGEAFEPDLLQEDHVHPNVAGQKIIAEKLQAALLEHFTFQTK